MRNWKEKAESAYRSIKNQLAQNGEARLVCNGKDYRMYQNGMSGLFPGIEVTELQPDMQEDFVLMAERVEELESWIAGLCEEEARQPVQFLHCFKFPTENGEEWASKISSLPEIARTIGCRDFNETDHHRVYAVICGIPIEIHWEDRSRNLCIDFGEFGNYEYPDH